MIFRKLFHIDYDLYHTLVLRSWSILSGVVMVACIPFWLTAGQQGYYYTYNSLLGLQIFFDMGLNYVIIQIVSHEFALLKINNKGFLKGANKNIARLSHLFRILEKWYSFISLTFLVVVGVGGGYFLGQDGTLPNKDWLPAWLMLVLMVTGNLNLGYKFAILEGCGKVGDVARMRFNQSVIANIIIWCLLSLQVGLSSMPIGQGAGFIYACFWLSKKANIITGLKKNHQQVFNKISWRREIFPMQWRIALSWMSGYFIFQILTPMIFSHQGAIEAGRLGLTQGIFLTLQGFGMSWVNVKMPRFGMLIARGNILELNKLFFSSLLRALVFTCIASAGIVSFIYVCNLYSLPLAQRLVSPKIAICISIVTVINTIIFSIAVYCRAHKEEPFLVSSMTLGILIAISSYFGSLYSISIAMYLYVAVTIFIGLPWSILIFKKYYRSE